MQRARSPLLVLNVFALTRTRTFTFTLSLVLRVVVALIITLSLALLSSDLAVAGRQPATLVEDFETGSVPLGVAWAPAVTE